MKITKLHIYGFGQFTDVKLDFISNFHVIYGENEAGKSTLLAFVYAVLFGFPTKNQSENRYFPRTSHHYGGNITLETENFESITIERIYDKNKVSGVVKVHLEDGTIKDEAFLAEFLGSLNKEIFKAIFAFDLSGLQNIDNLSGEALSNYLLNAGIIGNGRLQQVETLLEKEQVELYKPSGKNPELNKKLEALFELNQQLITLKAQIDSYYHMKETLADKQERLEELTEQKVKLLAELREYEKTEQAIHTWQEKSIELDGDINFYQNELKSLETKRDILTLNREVLEYKEDIQQYLSEENYFRELTFEQNNRSLKLADYKSKKEMIVAKLGANWDEASILAVEASIAAKNQLMDIETEMDRLTREQTFLDEEMERRRETLEQLEDQEANLKTQRSQQKNTSRLFPMILIIAGILLSAYWFMLGEWIVAALLAIAFIGSGGYVYRFHLANPKLPNHDISTLTDRLREANHAYEKIAERYDHWEIEMGKLNQALLDWKRTYHFPNDRGNKHLLGVFELIIQYHDLHFQFKQEKEQLAKIIDKTNERQNRILALYALLFEEASKNSNEALRELGKLLESALKNMQLDETLQEKINMADASLQKLIDRKQSYITEANKLIEFIKEQNKDELEEKLGLIESNLQAIISEQAEISAKIKQLEEEGNYSDCLHKVEQEKFETRELAKKWAVYKVAEWMIMKTKEKYQKEKLPNVLKLASSYLEQLTGGNYQTIYLSDNPKDAFLLQRKDQQRFAVHEVSRGTAEQLYLAIRLALASKYQTKETLPLIFDDILVNFDTQRAHQSTSIFKKLAAERQIIFFTCHQHILQHFDASDIIDLNQLNTSVAT